MGVIDDVIFNLKNNVNMQRALAVCFLSGGGAAVAVQVAARKIFRRLKKEEERTKAMTAAFDSSTGGGKKSKATRGRVAVDAKFFARLSKIFEIIIPSTNSEEFALVVILGALMVGRTGFTVLITEIIGRNGQYIVARDWTRLWAGIMRFAMVTVPAAVINSGLKYTSSLLALMWRVRLSRHVHKVYLSSTNFYKACNLGGADRIDNADQRVTADIDNFCQNLAELYTTAFKPALDVVLFTGKLADFMGWKAPAFMYGYFVLSAQAKKVIMPSFGKLLARESELEGIYRTCHNRLITNSEEIAFYDGSSKEKAIINSSLQNVIEHSKQTRFLKFLVGIYDQLTIKYWASIAGYLALVVPIAYPTPEMAAKTTADLTREYIRTSQYLGALSSAVGDLVMMGNKLTDIAGYTARVSELLEMVAHLKEAGNKPFVIREDGTSEGGSGDATAIDVREGFGMDSALARKEHLEMASWLDEWRQNCDARDAASRERSIKETDFTTVIGGGKYELSENIEFSHVDLVSPDGKLLVKDLNFQVTRGVNVMVTGPNGSGKSSLFRVVGELWPLHCGVVKKPPSNHILFVPQKPYLVIGTLRDQIIYPNTPDQMRARGVTDADLARLLSLVDPARLIMKEWKMDDVRDWFHAFSGGQKQRIAMARLFYHRPLYAILDECTSAVSDEVEGTLYQTCTELGITLFTVSHRAQLRKYHDFQLAFEGGISGRWSWERIDKTDMKSPVSFKV